MPFTWSSSVSQGVVIITGVPDEIVTNANTVISNPCISHNTSLYSTNLVTYYSSHNGANVSHDAAKYDTYCSAQLVTHQASNYSGDHSNCSYHGTNRGNYSTKNITVNVSRNTKYGLV